MFRFERRVSSLNYRVRGFFATFKWRSRKTVNRVFDASAAASSRVGTAFCGRRARAEDRSTKTRRGTASTAGADTNRIAGGTENRNANRTNTAKRAGIRSISGFGIYSSRSTPATSETPPFYRASRTGVGAGRAAAARAALCLKLLKTKISR